MAIEFDPGKDAINIAKHGISLARAADLKILAFVDDHARFAEPRYRLYGLIDGLPYCVAAIDRQENMRIISVRRAHRKEFDQHVE